MDRVQRTRSISKLDSFDFCSLYRRIIVALMYNFQNLNWSGELSYVRRRRSWSCESWSRCLRLWILKRKDTLTLRCCYTPARSIHNKRERERGFTYYIKINEVPNHFTFLWIYSFAAVKFFLPAKGTINHVDIATVERFHSRESSPRGIGVYKIYLN